MPDTYIGPLELHAVGCPCCAGWVKSDDEPQAATALTTTIPGVSAYDLSTVDLRALLAYRSDTDSAGNFANGAARWNLDASAGKGLTYLEALNSTVGVGTGVALNYNFAQAAGVGGFVGISGFRPMNAIKQRIVVEQLAKWAAVANVTFTETTTNTGKTLSFGTDTFSADLAPAVGLGAYPGSVPYTHDAAGKVSSITYTPYAGDIRIDNTWLNRMQADGTVSTAEYNAISHVVLHEIGHALGLSHPFGNNTYSWAQDTAFRTTIYDAGGTDTIDLSASTMRSSIDLTPNSLSSINLRVIDAEKLNNTATIYHNPQNAARLYTGENNLGIVGTIENVMAGSGDDRINGNSVANEISGGAGNDSIWGGAGNDRVVAGSGNDYVDGGIGIDVAGLFGPRSSYSIAHQADGSLKVMGPEGADTYLGTEFLAFNDGGKVGLWLNADVKLGGGFDETFYLAHNADVAAVVQSGGLASGFARYLQWGQFEGRVAVDARSTPLYDEVGYLAMNPDVAAAVESGALRSGYDHYLAYGKAEGRSLTPLFDSAYYLTKNADVKAAGMGAWFHFMNYGWREGRNPSAYLDVSAYPDANSALKAAGVNPLTHYLQYGQGEGRLLVATADLGLDWTYLG